jgi:hypothetical protein
VTHHARPLRRSAAREQTWLFAAFLVAFAVKVPLFPVHTWLPDAHTEAPTGGSVFLAGVLLKMGTFGLLRYALPLFPDATIAFAPWLIGISVVGVLYGAIVALMQSDVKRLVAYSSVSHMGFVVLGTFALNDIATSAAVVQMVNHGLSTGALFLLIGFLYERRHTRLIADFGGLAKQVPVMAGLWLVVSMSSLALPGLNGFVGEFPILLGTFATSRTAAILAAFGAVLAALYLLWAYQRIFHGPLETEENRTTTDLTRRELVVMAPLIVLIVAIGLYPGPLFDLVGPSVDRVLAEVAVAGGSDEHPPGSTCPSPPSPPSSSSPARRSCCCSSPSPAAGRSSSCCPSGSAAIALGAWVVLGGDLVPGVVLALLGVAAPVLPDRVPRPRHARAGLGCGARAVRRAAAHPVAGRPGARGDAGTARRLRAAFAGSLASDG